MEEFLSPANGLLTKFVRKRDKNNKKKKKEAAFAGRESRGR